jgi:hypothetical protein
MGELASKQVPTAPGPAFDEIAESVAEYRRRDGEPDPTEDEVLALAVEETKAVRRGRRERLAHSSR